MKVRCMLCGKMLDEKMFVVEQHDEDDDYDEITEKKPSAFCIMCQAKLKNEADKGQKNPKPM